MGELLEGSIVGYGPELALFSRPISNIGVRRLRCVNFYPVNDFSTQGVIQFVISGTGSAYVDLMKSVLKIRCKIVKGDGNAVEEYKEGGKCAGPVNSFLTSMFQRVDIMLQDKMITHSDESYPYQAYLKTLLYSGADLKGSLLQAQMYYHDVANKMHEANGGTTDNSGLKTRTKFFFESNEVDMCGPLYCDATEMTKYLPNGVQISVTLYPSPAKFCLMSSDVGADYKVVVTRAALEVCFADVAPEILVAHAEILEKTPAIFPYMRTVIKKFTLAKGVYSGEINDAFQGRVPAEMIIGLVKESAQYGAYNENPFRFENFSLNFLQVTSDGDEIGHSTLQPKFDAKAEKGNYLEAYLSLCGADGFEHALPIERLEYPYGYCLYRFVMEADYDVGDDDIIPVKRMGNLRIALKFDEELSVAVTVIIMARFSSAFKIDKSRSVYWA